MENAIYVDGFHFTATAPEAMEQFVLQRDWAGANRLLDEQAEEGVTFEDAFAVSRAYVVTAADDGMTYEEIEEKTGPVGRHVLNSLADHQKKLEEMAFLTDIITGRIPPSMDAAARVVQILEAHNQGTHEPSPETCGVCATEGCDKRMAPYSEPLIDTDTNIDRFFTA